MARKITLAFNPSMKAAVGAAGIATASTEVDCARPALRGVELHYANKLGVAASSALVTALKGKVTSY